MADKKTNRAQKNTNSPLIGNQAKPTILDNTTKIDIDVDKILVDSIIGAGLSGGLDTSEIENFTSISNARDQVYQLIDTMAKDSTVSSILRTYSEDVCEPADNGHVVWCESNDPNISKFVNYLLNVMNVDKNIYSWVYCLLKYGDVYLRLYRESDYDDRLFKKDKVNKIQTLNEGLNDFDKNSLEENIKLNIRKGDDQYSYYVEMVADPSTMFELGKYGKTYGYIEVPNAKLTNFDTSETFMGGTNTNIFNYRLKSTDINIYQADDFVHASFDDNITRFPEQVQIFMDNKDFDTN